MSKNKQKAPAEKDRVVQIQIDITEIGNLPQNENNFFLEMEYMFKRIPPVRNEAFRPCSCGPTHSVNLTWITRLVINENEIMNISTNPLIVTLKTFEPSEPDDFKLPQSSEMKIVGYYSICLADMLSYESATIVKTSSLKITSYCFASIRTWPNTSFITYKVTSDEPLLALKNEVAALSHMSQITQNSEKSTVSRKSATSKKKNLENKTSSIVEEVEDTIIDPHKIMNFAITLECIINPKEEISQYFKNFDVAFNFPLENSMKQINFQKGELCNTINKMNFYKSLPTLMNYPGELGFSDIPINISFSDHDSYEIETEKWKPHDCYILSEPFINFQQFYDFRITRGMFAKFLNQTNVTIELYMSPSAGAKISQHYIGVINLEFFKHVDVKHIRQIIPLTEFKPAIFQKYPNCTPIFSKVTSKKIEIDPEFEFVLNESDLYTCIVLDMEFSDSFLPRKILPSPIDKQIELQLLPNYDRQLVDLNLKKRLFDYNMNCKDHFESFLLYESEFNAIIDKLTSDNFSFNINSRKEVQSFLEDVYILVCNKIHDAFNDGKTELYNNTVYRLKCATECLELSYFDEAEDFHIMNINDMQNTYKYYLDYTVYHLFRFDMNSATVCCNKVLMYNENSYEAFLLHAYTLFSNKDYSLCEQVLLKIIQLCENFVEAWVALFILYLSEDRKMEIESIIKNLKKYYVKKVDTYKCHLHKRKELLWKPLLNYKKDPYLIAIKYFIQWGCLQFAEVGLSYIVHSYGCDSFEYLYHMALVDYYRKDFSSALERCALIRTENIDLLCESKSLTVQSLLEMNSVTSVFELKRMRSRNEPKHDKACSKFYYLIYLKMSKMYFSLKKYRTAKYFAKICCYSKGTYCSFKLLGIAAFKCQEFNLAEQCFQIAYKINPYNNTSWANLALINYRRGRLPQFEICAKNAKKQPNSDKELIQIIEDIEESLNRIDDIKCEIFQK